MDLLTNLLTDYDFSTSELQKARRTGGILYILTYTRTSRHSGVQFSTSELEKVLRDRRFLKFFTRKHASRHSGLQFFDIRTSKSDPKLSRHSGVQFFDIGTSKSGPNLTCFVHFHLKMRFSPQRRAILIAHLTT